MDTRAADDPASEEKPDKKPYSPPVLLRWGTLLDITQAVGYLGNSDGATKGLTRKTR